MTKCPHLIELGPYRRPENALNMEPMQPAPRCRLRTPEHWGIKTEERWRLTIEWSPFVDLRGRFGVDCEGGFYCSRGYI